MDVTTWELYWIFQLDAIGSLLSGLAVSSIVLGIIIFAMGCSECDDNSHENDGWKRGLKLQKLAFTVIPLCILISVINTLLPTTKSMVAILAIPPVINNEQVQQLPTNVLNLLNKKLEELAE